MTADSRPEDAVGTGRPGAAFQLDPHGRASFEDERYVRRVTMDAARWLKPLHADGTLARWTQAAHLVRCDADAMPDREMDGDWVVTHPAVRPLALPPEWCGSMLKDAALATLDLLLAVTEDGYTLQDAHPHNVVFDGCRPVFVDLTSIVPVERRRVWTAYGQFLETFRNPLLLYSDGKGTMARRFLLDTTSGAPVAQVYPLLSVPMRCRHPGLSLGYVMERRLTRNPRLRTRLKDLTAKVERDVDRAARLHFIRRMRGRIAALAPSAATDDNWTNYYTEVDEHENAAEKGRVVETILRREGLRTVVDIGCNTGRYSLMAAAAGARVLALDGSETCVERLYARAKVDGLAITPIVADIVTPTPGHGFMSEEFAPLLSRAVSDGVLCLGLVHHLLVTGRQTEERVAEMMHRLARKIAVVELIEPDDPNVARINSARPIAYRTERLVGALRERFRSVETCLSDRPTRSLAICRQ